MTNIYIKTFGCSLNQSDSEVMAGLLEKADFKIVNSPETAELVIINSCTVKGPTETKVMKEIKKMHELGKKIVVTGCLPKATPGKVKGYSLISPQNINNIVEIVEETLHDNTAEMIADSSEQRLNLPKKRKNNIIEILPICAGCLGDCAYCITKIARGNLISYPKKDIIKQVKEAVKEGVKEIWLTAQDTGCYGEDIGGTLPGLLKEILKIEDNFLVRLGMCNPEHLLKYSDELIEIFKHPKMFKFLHVPMQSGNNEILKAMKRNYTKEQFEELVLKFRKEIPLLTVSTDVICGFPGESYAQFIETVFLIKKIKPDVLNISKFWARPKTKAMFMKKVPGDEIKKRSTYMKSVFDWISFERNKLWEGKTCGIIIDEIGKEDSFIGRNLYYKPVIVFGDYKMGQKIKVKIENVTKYDLRGSQI